MSATMERCIKHIHLNWLTVHPALFVKLKMKHYIFSTLVLQNAGFGPNPNHSSSQICHFLICFRRLPCLAFLPDQIFNDLWNWTSYCWCLNWISITLVYKSRNNGVLKIQLNIYDGAFCENKTAFSC